MNPAEVSSAFLTAGISDTARGETLALLDAYYDTAPRATARAEEHGPLVLFVAKGGWPFGAVNAAIGVLARQAPHHRATTVFCGAESNDVARVYESVGFRRVGTACTAEID